MLKWLKFTFGSFFSNTLSKEGAKRSFWNVVFALFICFIIMLSFLSAGYNFSIATHYNAASDFRLTAYNIFANENVSERVDLNIETVKKTVDGIESEETYAKASKNGSEIVINTFENEADALKYKTHGYDVIIDTRPSETTYFQFSVSYYLASDKNKAITADEYRQLADKTEYTGEITIKNSLVEDVTNFKVDSNGNGLFDSEDATFTTQTACEFLDTYTATLSEEHEYRVELKAIKDIKDNAAEYNNRMYSLFVRAYYSIEDAPTNLIYYERYYGYSTETKSYPKKNFFLITDIFSIVSFETDNGVELIYEGYYSEVENGSFYYPTNKDNLEAINKSIDVFFIAIFNSVSAINTLSIGINVFSFFPYIIISISLFGLLLYCICKLKNRAYANKFIEGFKIVSSYLPIASSFAGIISMICFFAMNSSSAYGIGCWGLLSILGFRTLVFVIGEEIAYKKNPLRDNVVKVAPVMVDKYDDNPIDVNQENINLSNVESSTKIIKNDVEDDEDEKMELM